MDRRHLWRRKRSHLWALYPISLTWLSQVSRDQSLKWCLKRNRRRNLFKMTYQKTRKLRELARLRGNRGGVKFQRSLSSPYPWLMWTWPQRRPLSQRRSTHRHLRKPQLSLLRWLLKGARGKAAQDRLKMPFKPHRTLWRVITRCLQTWANQ